MRVPLRPLTLALLLLVALVAGACGSDADDAATSASGDAATTADDGGGTTVEAFVLPTVAGGQLDFGDLEGQDTVLWFWAPW